MAKFTGENGVFVIDDEQLMLAKKLLMNHIHRSNRLSALREGVLSKSNAKRFRDTAKPLNHLVELGKFDKKLLDELLESYEKEYNLTRPKASEIVKNQRATIRNLVAKNRLRFNLLAAVESLKQRRKISMADARAIYEQRRMELVNEWLAFEQARQGKAGQPTFWTYYTPVLYAEYERLIKENGHDPSLINKYSSLVDSDS